MLLYFGAYSQTKKQDSESEGIAHVKVYEELKITREVLLKASSIKDILPGIPADCKIDSCAFLCSGRKGEFFNGEFAGSDDLQKQMDTKNTMKIYIQVLSSCPESHKPRYAIKVE